MTKMDRFDPEHIDQLFYTIADLNRVRLIQVVRDDSYCKANGTDSYIDRSYMCDRTIYLGIYNNMEYRAISFFHEMGHVLADWGVEEKAWGYGLKLAESYGITFSIDALVWAFHQFRSHVHGNIRELFSSKLNQLSRTRESVEDKGLITIECATDSLKCVMRSIENIDDTTNTTCDMP